MQSYQRLGLADTVRQGKYRTQQANAILGRSCNVYGHPGRVKAGTPRKGISCGVHQA